MPTAPQAQYHGFGAAISDAAGPLRDVVDEILAISAQIPAIRMKKAQCGQAGGAWHDRRSRGALPEKKILW
jgi:hypothetical protein